MTIKKNEANMYAETEPRTRVGNSSAITSIIAISNAVRDE